MVRTKADFFLGMMNTLTMIIIVLLTAVSGWLLYERLRLRHRLAHMTHMAEVKPDGDGVAPNQHQDEIASRRRIEDKLRRYLQLMDTIINAIPNPIYFRDGDDVFQGCNNAFAQEVMGLTRNRILGQRPRDLAAHIPDDLVACLERRPEKGLPVGGVSSFEAEVPCADGIRREFLFSVNMLPPEGEPVAGRVGVMLDLTQKNRASRERAQREKFQGVLETAGGVCHELNQPLQVISGYAEIIMAEMTPEQKMFRMAHQIGIQVERMADITTKLQKITHYETMDYGEHARIIDIHKSSRAG